MGGSGGEARPAGAAAGARGARTGGPVDGGHDGDASRQAENVYMHINMYVTTSLKS